MNPLPEDVQADQPVYVKLDGYNLRLDWNRDVFVEDILRIASDLIMDNCPDGQEAEQNEQWGIVAKCACKYPDYRDEKFLAIVCEKAIDGVSQSLKNFLEGEPRFYVLGKNLKACYDRLSDAGIYLNVMDDHWYHPQEESVIRLRFFIASEAARILLHSRPQDAPSWITDEQKVLFAQLNDEQKAEIERLYQESLRVKGA